MVYKETVWQTVAAQVVRNTYHGWQKNYGYSSCIHWFIPPHSKWFQLKLEIIIQLFDITIYLTKIPKFCNPIFEVYRFEKKKQKKNIFELNLLYVETYCKILVIYYGSHCSKSIWVHLRKNIILSATYITTTTAWLTWRRPSTRLSHAGKFIH